MPDPRVVEVLRWIDAAPRTAPAVNKLLRGGSKAQERFRSQLRSQRISPDELSVITTAVLVRDADFLTFWEFARRAYEPTWHDLLRSCSQNRVRSELLSLVEGIAAKTNSKGSQP